MQWDTPTDLREKRNTSIAGNITKYSILHTQESFDKKIITLSNFAFKKSVRWAEVILGRLKQNSCWQHLTISLLPFRHDTSARPTNHPTNQRHHLQRALQDVLVRADNNSDNDGYCQPVPLQVTRQTYLPFGRSMNTACHSRRRFRLTAM